ncbi:putative RNA-directed DNA polymerase [Lupinus albus]|uniref:Putative RNA-directed DNA polymerase n=1 Tax=Lupinus albus TaxID=3870 RepID=A0A6A4PSX2_LUPAL|nr:putative RNA-directed DNA polymerase [Lupinus albus]
MSPPPGLFLDNPHQVCKLHKSLYGLKLASREWHTTLSSALISLGYSHSQADQALFTKSSATSFTSLLVYVDDMVLAGDNYAEIQAVKHFLDQTFKIKDLGTLRFFLGLEIARNPDGIHLNQRVYILSLLEDSGSLAAKPAKVPFDPSLKLQLDQGTHLADVLSYRRLVGRLLYLTISRPYIAYVVQKLSLFMCKSMDVHYKAALHVLHYLKSSPTQGLFFSSSSSLKLAGFSDSD